jgi:hypothetical protein
MAWIEKGSSENIYDYIRRKEKQEDWDSCEGVIIENLSSYPLEYVNCGIVSGYSIKPVLEIFREEKGVRVIPPNHSAGLIYRLHQGGNFGKYSLKILKKSYPWTSYFFTGLMF